MFHIRIHEIKRIPINGYIKLILFITRVTSFIEDYNQFYLNVMQFSRNKPRNTAEQFLWKYRNLRIILFNTTLAYLHSNQNINIYKITKNLSKI